MNNIDLMLYNNLAQAMDIQKKGENILCINGQIDMNSPRTFQFMQTGFRSAIGYDNRPASSLNNTSSNITPPNSARQ